METIVTSVFCIFSIGGGDRPKRPDDRCSIARLKTALRLTSESANGRPTDGRDGDGDVDGRQKALSIAFKGEGEKCARVFAFDFQVKQPLATFLFPISCTKTATFFGFFRVYNISAKSAFKNAAVTDN